MNRSFYRFGVETFRFLTLIPLLQILKGCCVTVEAGWIGWWWWWWWWWWCGGVVVVDVCALVGGDGGGRWRTGGMEGGREQLFVSQTAGKYISCHNYEFALCRLQGGVGLKHQSRTSRIVSFRICTSRHRTGGHHKDEERRGGQTIVSLSLTTPSLANRNWRQCQFYSLSNCFNREWRDR